MINRVVLVGRLTRDPDVRSTNSGNQVASFSLAFDNKTKGADGKNTSGFINVTVFGKPAEFAANWFKKGTLVAVEGRLRERKFQRRDGTNASTIEIVADNVEFGAPNSNNNNSSRQNAEQAAVNEQIIGNNGGSFVDPDLGDDDFIGDDLADDDLPF